MTSLSNNKQKITENKLFIENYKILQISPENENNLEYNYHTVDIVANKLNNISKKNFTLACNIDRSGSMSFKENDNFTTLQYTIHTIKSIIYYLSDVKSEEKNIKDLNIDIIINAFDNLNSKIGRIKIGENTSDFIKKLDNIFPRGSTNISDAFKIIKEDDYYKNIDNSNKAHILFTDGVPNLGKLKANEILEENPGGKQILIGYGKNHGSSLLDNIAKISNGSYYYVDNIENAGMVYGEIIHNLLYECVKDININVKGCEIYDFKTNKWINTLKFNSLSSEQFQTVLMRSSWKSVKPIEITILYKESNNNILHSKIERFNLYNCTDIKSNKLHRDLTVEKQIFRQKILDYLNQTSSNLNNSEIINLKNKITVFEKELKLFIKNKELENDNFMEKLSTDIKIAYKGMDTDIGKKLITARLLSQGFQRAYEITNIDYIDNTINANKLGYIYNKSMDLNRGLSINLNNINNNNLDNNQDLSSILFNNNNIDRCCSVPVGVKRSVSCYATPLQRDIMKSCSQRIFTENNETD